MELSITKYTPMTPIRVENMAELEKELVMLTAHYTGLVLTEDQTKEGKKELATLRKFQKAISDERIRVKKEFMANTIDPFEADCKRLAAIVQEPIEAIDSQLKAFDEAKKEEKRQAILKLIEQEQMPEFVDIEKIWDPRWLNTTYSLKSVDEDIVQRKMKIIGDLKTLDMLPEFSWEAMEVYKKTLDLNLAIDEGKRLLDLQKRKEAERARKEEEIQKKLETEPAPYANEIAAWIGFEAFMTASQAKALGAWMRQNGIKYRRPQN